MHQIFSLGIWLIVAAMLFPGYALSSCCYSISIQSLQPSSTYKPDNNAPPSYAISLHASSQFAVNNPGGPVYVALITFPGTYVLSTIPSDCVSVSINAVSCTCTGANRLVANFARVIVADGTQPKLESVVINGEFCTLDAGEGGCPNYTRTTSSWNPTATLSSLVPVPSSQSTNNPSSTRTSQSVPSTSSLGSLPPQTSLSISSSSPSCSSPCITPTFCPNETPTSKAIESHSSLVGLIVGLSLAIALLIFIVCLYLVRRHRRNLQSSGGKAGMHGWWGNNAIPNVAALFRIRHKGSRVSLSRASLHDTCNLHSASGNGEKILPNNDNPFSNPRAPSIARSISLSSATNSSFEKPAKGIGLGQKLLHIPGDRGAGAAPTQVNYFQNENDDIERDPDAEFTEATSATTDLLHKDQLMPMTTKSSLPWLTRAASKSARLHRAVSAASNRLLPLHRDDVPRRSSHDQQFGLIQEKPSTGNHVPGRERHKAKTRSAGPRFPKGGSLLIKQSKSDQYSTHSPSTFSISFVRPPKSIHRSSSRDLSPTSINAGGQIIATIRPEHHQQLIHQQHLDQGLAPDHPLPSYAYHQLAAGATTAGTAANAAALLAATAQGGGLYRSISTGSAADLNTAAFTNPGPPPQPPTLGATSSSARTGRGRSRSDTGRKTYNQPIHIRPPGPTFQPHQQQRPPSEGVERGSGLYGYM